MIPIHEGIILVGQVFSVNQLIRFPKLVSLIHLQIELIWFSDSTQPFCDLVVAITNSLKVCRTLKIVVHNNMGYFNGTYNTFIVRGKEQQILKLYPFIHEREQVMQVWNHVRLIK